MDLLAGAIRFYNLVGGTQRGTAKTYSLQKLYLVSLSSCIFSSPRILLRSADNLQNVKKEKFVFLLWLSASLLKTLKRCKENSLIAHQ